MVIQMTKVTAGVSMYTGFIVAYKLDNKAMAIYLLLDNKLIGIFEPLVPSRNVPSTNTPYSISGATKEQAPQTLTGYNWLYGGHNKYNTVDN